MACTNAANIYMCECIYFKVVNKIVFLNYQKLCTFFFGSYVCVSHKIEIEILCACCGAVLRPKLIRLRSHMPSQNMPSSMVKYVSRKYLCANNRMRNERNFRWDNTHSVNAALRWSIRDAKLTEEYVIYVIRRMCTTLRSISFVFFGCDAFAPMYHEQWDQCSVHSDSDGHDHCSSKRTSFITQRNEL